MESTTADVKVDKYHRLTVHSKYFYHCSGNDWDSTNSERVLKDLRELQKKHHPGEPFSDLFFNFEEGDDLLQLIEIAINRWRTRQANKAIT